MNTAISGVLPALAKPEMGGDQTIDFFINHGLGICWRYKVFEAMNMKLDHFKKAAKRYSADACIPVTTAQEKLATYFGFTNFDSAQKSMKKQLERAESEQNTPHQLYAGDGVTPLVPKPFWCNLNVTEFRLLCHLLKVKNLPATKGTDLHAWALKSVSMFEAVLPTMPVCDIWPGTTKQLIACLGLSSIESMYITLHKQIGPSENHGLNWPDPTGRIARYLEVDLPAYKVDKLLLSLGLKERPSSDHGRILPRDPFAQDSMAGEQHGYRVSQIYSLYLDDLRFIENKGGPGQMAIGQYKSLADFLKFITVNRRTPNATEHHEFDLMLTDRSLHAIYG